MEKYRSIFPSKFLNQEQEADEIFSSPEDLIYSDYSKVKGITSLSWKIISNTYFHNWPYLINTGPNNESTMSLQYNSLFSMAHSLLSQSGYRFKVLNLEDSYFISLDKEEINDRKFANNGGILVLLNGAEPCNGCIDISRVSVRQGDLVNVCYADSIYWKGYE